MRTSTHLDAEVGGHIAGFSSHNKVHVCQASSPGLADSLASQEILPGTEHQNGKQVVSVCSCCGGHGVAACATTDMRTRTHTRTLAHARAHTFLNKFHRQHPAENIGTLQKLSLRPGELDETSRKRMGMAPDRVYTIRYLKQLLGD